MTMKIGPDDTTVIVMVSFSLCFVSTCFIAYTVDIVIYKSHNMEVIEAHGNKNRLNDVSGIV